MKHAKLLLCLSLSFSWLAMYGQQKLDYVRSMNAALDDKSEIFSFADKTGALEQHQGPYFYRLKLEDIGTIQEQFQSGKYNVTVGCRFGNCFSLLKEETNTSNLNQNVYVFSSGQRSSRFAHALFELSKLYQQNGDEIQTSFLTISEESKPIVKAENPPVDKIAPPPPKKDALDELLEKEDKEEKDNTNAEEREEKDINVKPKRTAPATRKTKTEEGEEEKEEVVELETKSSGRKVRKDRDDEDNSAIGGLAEKETASDEKTTKNSLLCKQLTQILQSGAMGHFKSIEGTETNTKTKINESKVKLKGAKRNYLSWHKKERAFIAEFKSTKDLDLLQIEYDELQTEIDNCLGPDWEFADKSSDEEYAEFSGEVRDTEYHNTVIPNSPTVRVILLSDNDKFTLFIRIQ
jgi:hypothetical protein